MSLIHMVSQISQQYGETHHLSLQLLNYKQTGLYKAYIFPTYEN
jgi:hypothetical protein